MVRGPVRLLLAAAATFLPCTSQAKLTLREVVLHGARKTTVRAVQARIQMQQGDLITFARIDEARERLFASGLFREVDVWLDMPREDTVRLMYLDGRAHSTDLHVTLEEKQSWFAFPIASTGGGQTTGGLVYVDRSVGGHGVEVAGAGQHGTTRTDAQLGLRDPILAFAPLTYAFAGVYRAERLRFFENHRKILDVPTKTAGGEVQVGYAFVPHTRLLIHALYRWQEVETPTLRADPSALDDTECSDGGLVDADGRPVTVEPAYNCGEGHIVRPGLSLGYDRTSAPEGLRRGARVRFRGDVADRFWKSDFDYARLDVLLGFYGYLWRTYPSAVLRGTLVYPTSERGVPVTETLRAGGSDLRGYQVGEFHGDTLVAMQLEEQVPLLRLRRPWRLNFVGAVFADFAALLERHPGGRIVSDPTQRIPVRPEFEDFHTSVGAGVRLLIPGIAIPAIRLDVGYGIDVQDYAVSFSLGMP